MNKRTAFLFTLCFLITIAGTAIALKNACPDCGTVAKLTDLACKKCNRVLNQCFACGNQNPVSADYCQTCFEPLAQMRVLSTIASGVREDLKLGQSDMAQLDRERGKLDFLVKSDPANKRTYLFRKAKILRQMGSTAQEVHAWKDYLKEFPDTPKKAAIQVFCSEALRKWGYLFFAQGNKAAALEKFQEATRMNPMNADAWQWVGRLHNEAKEYQASGDAYLEALKAKPGDKTSIHFLRGLKRAVAPDLLAAPKKIENRGKVGE